MQAELQASCGVDSECQSSGSLGGADQMQALGNHDAHLDSELHSSGLLNGASMGHTKVPHHVLDVAGDVGSLEWRCNCSGLDVARQVETGSRLDVPSVRQLYRELNQVVHRINML